MIRLTVVAFMFALRKQRGDLYSALPLFPGGWRQTAFTHHGVELCISFAGHCASPN
jgi:hypothetical protein